MSKTLKQEASPLDKAVFGSLNAGLMGFVFSLDLISKNSEFFRYNKSSFIIRNIFLFSSIYGLNQFISEYNKKRIKNKLIRIVSSSFIPSYVTYCIYSFKNNFAYFSTPYFSNFLVFPIVSNATFKIALC